MKLKELAYLLGLKPPLRTYGVEVLCVDLSGEGCIDFARWLHPRDRGHGIDQGMVDALRTFLRPGDVAIDIGAHCGDTAVPMALAVGRQGAVLALEPNPYVFPVLARNAELNPDRAHIIPLMFAATPTDGEFEFEYSDAAFSNGGRHEGISRWRHAHAFQLKVQGRNLQNYLRAEHASLVPRLRYVKVDAEGYDLTILRSLEDTLLQTRPFIRAEVYRHTRRARRIEMIGFVERLGYTVHKFGGERAYRGEHISAADVMRWTHYDIFCVPAG